jgi:mediator of RNA polymerase II transcription subunit 7
MAEQGAIAAAFPAPPPFYKHFTKQNLAALRRLHKAAKDSHNEGDSESSELDIRSLPIELQYLIPPQPPKDEKYTSFGVEIDRHAPDLTLEAAGIEQVYPSHPSVRSDPQPHLIALARSLLASFLSLVGILSQSPELYEEKTKDLQTLMYNMHDLINQYRPHQARETLILLMEERVERMKREIRGIEDAKDKVRTVLQTLERQDASEAEGQDDKSIARMGDKTNSADAERRNKQLQALRAIEDELG